MIVLVYCILSLFSCMIFMLSPTLCDTRHTPITWCIDVSYSCSKYRSTRSKQTNKQGDYVIWSHFLSVFM